MGLYSFHTVGAIVSREDVAGCTILKGFKLDEKVILTGASIGSGVFKF